MSKGTLAKVMKYELRYLDGCGDFQSMQEQVWELQRKTRAVLNYTIQTCFHWDYINREHFKQTGEYLSIQTETGYKRLDGYIYNQLKDECRNMAAANINATIQTAWAKYNSAKAEILRGTMSIPSYKRDHPLVLNKTTVKFEEHDGEPVAVLALFSNQFKKETGCPTTVRFAMRLHDKTQRSIYQQLQNGNYKLGQCQLIYDRPKWYLMLTYLFTKKEQPLDPDKILGVDLGETYAIYASSVGEYGALKIEGGEVTDYARKLEARKRSMQRQAAHCGDGRKGHGTKTRVSAAYQTEDKIANFRKTANHRYSKALIDYAVHHQYGTIQIEDLSGIKSSKEFPKFLRHWTYFDLQAKIEAKAAEQGIRVVKVDPRYTSQRCSKCGNIDPKNRPSQAKFCCTSCGFEANADFNASQNLSIRDIEKLIQETVDANHKQT